VALQAAVLRPEAPDASAVVLPAAHAAAAPRAAWGAAEVPQQEAAARAGELRPEAVPDASAVLRREEVRDVAVRLPAAPGARAVALPSAAAVWVFLQAPPPAPSPTVRVPRAMESLRIASP
jgi:hypothetical protein